MGLEFRVFLKYRLRETTSSHSIKYRKEHFYGNRGIFRTRSDGSGYGVQVA
jgi:hypothetical protein